MVHCKYIDLFLDFDDTLYDTHGNAILALKELYDEVKLKELSVSEELFYERYWAANVSLWAQYSKAEITRDYLIVERFRRPLIEASTEDSPLKEILSNPQSAKDFCLNISDKFLALCSVKPGLVEGAKELMDHLKKQGYKLHICSNGFHEVQYKKLRACGLFNYFDTIILSEDAGANKPSKQFFDYALEKTGAAIDTTIMIGDNYNTDILGAQGVGIDTMLFNRWDPTFEPPTPVNYIVNDLLSITNIL